MLDNTSGRWQRFSQEQYQWRLSGIQLLNMIWGYRSKLKLCNANYLDFNHPNKLLLKLRSIDSQKNCGRSYLHSHVSLNNWITLSYYLSMYSLLPAATSFRSKQWTLTILKHTFMGSIFSFRWGYFFWVISLHNFYCIIDLAYRPIRSMYNVSHGFSSSIFVFVRSP